MSACEFAKSAVANGLDFQKLFHKQVERFHFFNVMLSFICGYRARNLCNFAHAVIKLIKDWNFEVLGNADT